jgi:chromodomain-helicase-DNA-binding protein 7
MNVMMELRKCCNHPFLIRGVEDHIINNNNNNNSSSITNDNNINNNSNNNNNITIIATENVSNNTTNNNNDNLNNDFFFKKMVESSGKFVLLDKLLPKLLSQGNKVLIFSQMVKVLNIIEDYLKHKKYSFERLDGSTKTNDRKMAVENFCNVNLNRFVMLLSTKAGFLKKIIIYLCFYLYYLLLSLSQILNI